MGEQNARSDELIVATKKPPSAQDVFALLDGKEQNTQSDSIKAEAFGVGVAAKKNISSAPMPPPFISKQSSSARDIYQKSLSKHQADEEIDDDRAMMLERSPATETMVEAAAADWEGVGSEEGVLIWRIEQFKVVPWPRNKYGSFHEGDSFIILHTYKPKPTSDVLAYDLFYWIGSTSTHDEYGAAAYKAQELDAVLGDVPVQYREEEGNESERFLQLFEHGIMILSGGVPSGFNTVVSSARPDALFRVKGRGNRVRLRQLPLQRSVLGSGDVYILDCAVGIFQWNGAKSNMFERQKASWFCTKINDDRAADGDGVVPVHVLSEGQDDSEPIADAFWTSLPGERVLVSMSDLMSDADVQVAPLQVIGFEVAGAHHAVSTTLLHRGKQPPVSLLRSDSVVLLDTGFELFIREGTSATQRQKAAASAAAASYLESAGRPVDLPTTRFREGQEERRFLDLFVTAAAEEAGLQAPCAVTGIDDEFAPDRLRAAFKVFDVNDDNKIDASEFLKIVQREAPGGQALSEADAQHLLSHFDTNGDGVLDVEEFIEAVAPTVVRSAQGSRTSRTSAIKAAPATEVPDPAPLPAPTVAKRAGSSRRAAKTSADGSAAAAQEVGPALAPTAQAMASVAAPAATCVEAPDDVAPMAAPPIQYI